MYSGLKKARIQKSAGQLPLYNKEGLKNLFYCGEEVFLRNFYTFAVSKEINADNRNVTQDKREKIMFDIRKIQEDVIYKAVKAESDEETARKVVYGGQQTKAENNPEWVKAAMHRLESSFDSGTVKQIRRNCQCGYGMEEKLALVKELKAEASNIEEFAASGKARAAGLFCRDGELFLQFGFCPCPMLAEVERLETDTWCQCTTGYSKVLFETAFSCRADVELLKSIKMGDDVCLMKITLHNPDWR